MLRYFLDFAKQSLRDTLWKNNSGNVCKFENSQETTMIETFLVKL